MDPRVVCAQWRANPTVNPLTGRAIKVDGPTYKKLQKDCIGVRSPSPRSPVKRPVGPLSPRSKCEQWRANPTINPVSRRKIKRNGPVYKALKKECESVRSRPASPVPKRASPRSGSPKRASSPKRSPLLSQSELNQALFDAIEEENVAKVRSLLSKGANPNTNDEYFTVLHAASQYGPENVVLLLRAGANPNVSDLEGDAPIHLVEYQGGGVDVVRALLDGGADINRRNDKGETALHLAAKAGDIDSAKLLIERGANVNAKDKAGHSITNAVSMSNWGTREMLNLLVQNKATPPKYWI